MFTLKPNTMILKNRNELKSLFKNKSRLSEVHFAALIESVLNKREDQFHGVWQSDRTYRKGDVVIHQGTLWEMISHNEICSHDTPGKDKGNWQSIIVPINGGMLRSMTLYQNMNTDQIDTWQRLTTVLETVKLLQPISFHWKSDSGFDPAKEQLGLLADELEAVFPQVVNKETDGTAAIAYQNLVPILIQSIKELLEQRDQLQQALQTLQTSFEEYQQQTEQRLQELTARIES